MRFEKKALLFRRFVSLVLIIFAFWHSFSTLADKDKIHPTTHLGWVNEQLEISFMLLICGIWLAWNSKHKKSTGAHDFEPLLSAGFLFLLCILIFSRYFWLSAAIFATLALIDAFCAVLCLKNTKSWIQ